MSEEKFILPPPKFKDEIKKSLDSFSRHLNPHFSTPNGMLLPRDKQPPPMFGPRGSTVPPQFLSHPRKRSANGHYKSAGPGSYQQNQSGGMRNNQRAGFKDVAGGQNHRSPRPPNNNGLDKEVRPELLVLDWKLWCEGCDVNCRSEEEFEQHKANHAPCLVTGCKFVGHPMIMKRHNRLVHRDSECAKDIVGPSTEEVEQWKEQRRKRYPTKQNVILRQQAQDARFNRGERIEEKKDRFPNRHGTMNGNSTANGVMVQNARNTNRSKRKRRSKIPFKNTVAVVDEKLGRIAFTGTSSLKEYKEPLKNSLAMLGDYGTDTESSLDEAEQIDGRKTPEKCVADKRSQQPDNILSEGEIVGDNACDDVRNSCSAPAILPDLVCQETQSKDVDAEKLAIATTSESVPLTIQTADCVEAIGSSSTVGKQLAKQQNKAANLNNPKDKHARKPNRGLLDYSKLRRSNQNTMLEKLLDVDIRHERNNVNNLRTVLSDLSTTSLNGAGAGNTGTM
uniref:FMR1-interacting protein 1 conserved domain-containing protein n=1 Tax=Anopheles christyi TaxID=43041 RepID=A0A182JTI3_9DIPT